MNYAVFFLIIAYFCKTYGLTDSLINDPLCSGIILTASNGSIQSPNYPYGYPEYISCDWTIYVPPNSYLQIKILDLDFKNEDCDSKPCCGNAWLTLPSTNHDSGVHKYCNSSRFFDHPIRIFRDEANVRFHSSKLVKNESGRGFLLEYYMIYKDSSRVNKTISSQEKCTFGMFQCDSGECIPGSFQCDFVTNCVDNSDEINCSRYCPPGKILCNADPGVDDCYSPTTQKCDGVFDCPLGEDEFDCFPECRSSFKCETGKACYSIKERCNLIKNCADNSDEYNCPTRCDISKRVCNNGNCIASQLWCNGIDDCGDESDETSCFRNTLIAAAVMGVLLCGLLLIIAVACTCRLYSLRLSHARFRMSPHLTSRLRLNQQVSLPPLIDDEFFHREPPPAYSVAIGDYPPPILQPLQPMPSRQMSNQFTSHSRRVRRFGSSRRIRTCEGLNRNPLPYQNLPEAASSLITAANEPILQNSSDCDKPLENVGRVVDSSSNSDSNVSPVHGSINSSSSGNATDNTILLSS